MAITERSIRYVSPSAASAHAAAMDMTVEEPPWKHPLVLDLARALELVEGWDSYSAPRVANKAVNLALHLLEVAAPRDAPTPTVVPTTEGGIQLEWHCAGIDLELEVSPVEPPQFSFRDRNENRAADHEIGADLSQLVGALAILARRTSGGGGR